MRLRSNYEFYEAIEDVLPYPRPTVCCGTCLKWRLLAWHKYTGACTWGWRGWLYELGVRFCRTRRDGCKHWIPHLGLLQ